MTVFSSVLLYLLFHFTKCEDCVIDNRSLSTAWEEKLRDNLFSCANPGMPPPANNTNVTLTFTLKSFYFDDKEEVFSINTRLILIWNDTRLKWSPDKYDGITEIILSSKRIWTPDLSHYNTAGNDEIDYFVTHCRVTSDGFVSCIPLMIHQSVCSSKLKDWPYDTQNCTFKFGLRSKNGRVTFTLNSSRAVRMLGAEYGTGWNIIDFSSGEDPKTTIQFHLNFILERQGVGLAAVVIVPTLVLSSLVVTSMFLNVDDRTRLGILFFDLLNQFVFLREINSNVPKNSVDIPTILIYTRFSIILTLVLIGISFLLRSLRKITTPPPNFIVTLNETLFEPYGKYLIWPRWEINIVNQNNDEATIKIAAVWADFSSIINFLTMIIITIIFISCVLIYIPQQPQF